MGEIIRSSFQPPWWLRSAHIQTLWGPLGRSLPIVNRHTERLPLADGDHLILHWAGPEPRPGDRRVLLMHGLSGCSDSHYMRATQAALAGAGIASVAVNSRGAQAPNDTALCYHAGEIDDLDTVINSLHESDPQGPLLAIGVSLGGSRLLNWLARADSGKLSSVVSVCAPLRLASSANRLDRGLSKIYRNHLLKQLLDNLQQRQQHLEEHNPAEADRLAALNTRNIRSFWQYDEQIIAPLYGFRSAEHYYARCSAGSQLKQIRTPTLLIHAADDPFMTREVIPQQQDLGPAVTLELARHGGHVGFIGHSPRRYWLEQRLLAYVQGWRPLGPH